MWVIQTRNPRGGSVGIVDQKATAILLADRTAEGFASRSAFHPQGFVLGVHWSCDCGVSGSPSPAPIVVLSLPLPAAGGQFVLTARTAP